MKFGALKSKIEEKLNSSYINETFDKEIKVFNKLILEKKNVAKAYYLYDELSRPKGFDLDYAKEYLKECIEQYNNLFISEGTLNKIDSWVKDIKVKKIKVTFPQSILNPFCYLHSKLGKYINQKMIKIHFLKLK